MTDMDITGTAESPQRRPVKNGTWLPIENTRLREAVAKYGTQWVRVAKEVGTRNGDQCAKRWNENLNPNLDHGPWAAEEDQRLLTMVRSYGRNWKLIADHFLDLRAPLALKNRYSLLLRRQNRQESIPPPPILSPPPPSSQNTQTSSISSSPGVIDLATFWKEQEPHLADFGAKYANAISNPFAGGYVAADSQPRSASWTETTVGPSCEHLPFLSGSGSGVGGLDSCNASPGPMDAEEMVMSEKSTCQSSPHSGDGDRDGDGGTGLGDSAPVPGLSEVEYSVTCQWGKVKTLMGHLVDAAIAESAQWTTKDDQVSVMLRLKV